VGERFFWYRPTRVVPDKGPLDGCLCVLTCRSVEAQVGQQAVTPAASVARHYCCCCCCCCSVLRRAAADCHADDAAAHVQGPAAVQGRPGPRQQGQTAPALPRRLRRMSLPTHPPTRGVVVNFDLGGDGFRDPGPSNGELAPPRTACSPAGGACGTGSPPLADGVRGVTPGKFFEIFDTKSRVRGQFGPENKLIEGRPNAYDVICRNASVLTFHLWPTIFAGASFRLQNICRNDVPPRSRTTTPLPSTLTREGVSTGQKMIADAKRYSDYRK